MEFPATFTLIENKEHDWSSEREKWNTRVESFDIQLRIYVLLLLDDDASVIIGSYIIAYYLI